MKIMKRRPRMTLRVAVVVGVALTSLIAGSSGASASSVPRPVIRSGITNFDSLQTPKKATANCLPGERVLGGGGRVNGAQNVVITEQQPVHASPDSFVVSAIEDQAGTTQSWNVEAFAVCSVPLPGLKIVSETGPAGSFGFQGKSADCSGQNVLGVGGRINNGMNQVALNTQGLFPQRASAGGFEDADGFAGLWSVTAFAVCATLNSVFDSAVVSVPTATDTTARKIFSAPCPPGMNVTGGGAFANFPAVVEVVSPTTTQVQVIARKDGTATQWQATAYAFCTR
jgi:hypothetical protein